MAEKKQNNLKKLFRSETNKVIGGIAGGLGEYFDVDPTIIRLAFVLITLAGGSGVLIYLILWLIIPPLNKADTLNEETIRLNANEIKDKANLLADNLKNRNYPRSHKFFGIVIIFLGFIALSRNLGFYPWFFNNNFFWPALLILLGVLILTRDRRR